MTAAAAELQKAIFSALTADAALNALTGAGKLFDAAPANAQFPYVTFGRTSIFDWSTGTEKGTEHLVTLHVWSKAKGRKEAQAIMERLRALLDDAALPMAAHHLVNLRVEFAEIRHDDDLSVEHGLVRFRAVVEEQ